MPRLSILIPCLGGAAEFDGALVSVLQNRPADCEVLVLHTQPYDDPYNLRGEVRFVRAASRTLVELINAGLEAASGEIVHILGCGLEASEDWTAAALAHFADDEVAAVAPTVVTSDGQQAIAAGVCWTLGGARKLATARSFKVVAPLVQAGFFRRNVLSALGGLELRLGDELADVGLGLVLRELGLKTVCEPKSRIIQTAAELPAATTNSFAQGQRAERLFWRHAGQAGMALALIAHPFTVAADFCSRLPTIGSVLNPLGRLLGLCEFGSLARYRARLAETAERLTESSDEPATVSMAAARAQAAPAASSTRRKAA